MGDRPGFLTFASGGLFYILFAPRNRGLRLDQKGPKNQGPLKFACLSALWREQPQKFRKIPFFYGISSSASSGKFQNGRNVHGAWRKEHSVDNESPYYALCTLRFALSLCVFAVKKHGAAVCPAQTGEKSIYRKLFICICCFKITV